MALASEKLTYSTIANTIGEGSKDVARLCKNSNINPWSKWKPIDASLDTLTANQLMYNDYGVEWLSSTTPESLLTKVQQNGNKGFIYRKPTYGSRCRQGDFRNYEHNAASPIYNRFANGETIEATKDKEISLASATSISSPTTLGYDDIPTRDGAGNKVTAYHGIMLIKNNTVKWTTNVMRCKDFVNFFDTDNITAFEFLSTKDFSNTNDMPTNMDRFYALPYPIYSLNMKEIVNKKVEKAIINLDAKYVDATLKQIFVNVHITGKGSNKYIEVTGGEITNVGISLSTSNRLQDVFATQHIADSIIVEKDKDFFSRFIPTSYVMNNISRQNHVWVMAFYDNQLQQAVQIEWFDMNMLQTEDKRHNKNIGDEQIKMIMENNNSNNNNTTNGEG